MTSRSYFIPLCFLLLFSVAACSSDTEEQQQPPPPPPPLQVKTITLQSEQVPIWLEYTGKTEASKRIEVRARVPGILEQVLFADGDFVEKGQKLFVIEKTSYQARLDQARALLEQDRASLRLAETDVQRYRPLVEKDLAPRATLDQYMAKADELRAKLKSDQAAIREAELTLSYTDVLAPQSGRASRRNVDVGNIVGYGEQTLLTTIIFDDPMYAYFNPSEEEFQIMRQHKSVDIMPAKVRIPDNRGRIVKREEYSGKVDFGDNRVDRMTGTITMRAVVSNARHDLLEGTFVYVSVFITDQANFIMIPPGVVLEDQQGSFVYILDADSKAKRANITRGFENRFYLQVREGLKSGDTLIISGLQNLREGRAIAATDVTKSKGVLAVMKQQKMTPGE